MRQKFLLDEIEEARSIIERLNKRYNEEASIDMDMEYVDSSPELTHNSYDRDETNNKIKKGGIIWSLLGNGHVFERIIQHPDILDISRALLGPGSTISSFTAHTVTSGMGAQPPHLDYPYYDGMFPNLNEQRSLLSASFLIMLTDFSKENGATRFRSGSQLRPAYPHDTDDFYKNSVALEGEAGDVGVFAASCQHGAFSNRTVFQRIGLVATFVPAYLKPYHDIRLKPTTMTRSTVEMKKITADFPYPTKTLHF